MSNCEDCGTKLIDNCFVCGAPVCCPKCCKITTMQVRMDRIKSFMKNQIHHKHRTLLKSDAEWLISEVDRLCEIEWMYEDLKT